jgi:hypothetical protein
MWLLRATVGRHGVFSHFPVMLIGILGIGAVMHRHWPNSTKTLAAVTAIGALLVVLTYRFARVEWSSAMFATRWFILFMPLLLFWSGAWLRRSHRPIAWGLAGAMLLFSALVGLVGATDPAPRHGFDRYTAAAALLRLTQSDITDAAEADAVAHGR